MDMNNCFDSISISASGLSAERIRMNIIANNIANMHTTQTEEGGPYRRQYVIFEEVLDKVQVNDNSLSDTLGGVKVAEIGKSNSEPVWVYKPDDPNAMKDGPHAGQVAMPNINPVSEMVDMITAQRAYEANVQAIAAARSIISKALEIGK